VRAPGSRQAGSLVLVATPIGNLDDLAPRAAATLAEADLVVCEDTRRTGRLLAAAGIGRRPLLAVHDHNEASSIGTVLAHVRSGEVVAVVSDAGLPGISDPGERLVRAAAAEGLDVSVVPGPSAALAALAVSGLPTGRVAFEGFLPRRGSGREERLADLRTERRTIVLFEAPHRLARTLADLVAALGPDRRVAVVRELTKLHEETWRGTLTEALARSEAAEPRGEHVLVVEGGAPPEEAADDELSTALADLLAAGLSTRDAVAEVASAFAVPRRRVYALATSHR
jgi:16S rRNA (cytidine1402-2'-O)-methyltransferase